MALGLRPSLHAAAKDRDELKVSIQAIYDKVNHTEPQLVRALVQASRERLTPVVEHLKLQQPPWAAGYRVRVLDGETSWRRARSDASCCAASEVPLCPDSRWWCMRRSGTWW